MAQATPTPALTVAAKAGVSHEVHKYEHDPAHESFGLEAAEKLGVEPDRVFKTLVVSIGDELVVGVVPVNQHLDVKAIASVLHAKSAAMAEVGLVERTTGYVVGAISPLGQKKRLRTVIDASALQFTTIYVSAGRRGLEIELSIDDLVSLTNAAVAPIAR